MKKTALAAAVAAALCACSTPLHTAAGNGDLAAIRSLLASGANIEAWNESADRWTPLMYAVHYGQKGAVIELLAKGASLTARGSMGTALEIAERENKTDIAAILKNAERGSALAQTPAPTPRAAAPAAAAVPAPEPATSDVDEPSYSSRQRPDDFALVVGIEDYPNLPKASHALRDAAAVRRHLKALGVPERNVISLTNASATRGKLSAYLDEWLPRNVKPDSRVFFYYSGHGAPDPKNGQAYLVPSDGDPMFLQSTAYPLKDLYAKLGKLPAKQIIVALDACFSGAGGRSVLAQGARPLVVVRDALKPSGPISVLAAASGEEITGALEEQGHGMFTYFLLKGLSEGKRSTKDLNDFIKPRVQDEARRQNREQTPALLGEDLKL